MTDPLTLVLAPSSEVVDSTVGDETVILHLGSETYYGLDPVGTVIWDGLKAGQSVAEIRAAIIAAHDVTEEVVEADMRRFIADLIDRDILVVS